MAYVEMAIAAARKVQPADVLALSDVKFVKACLVADGQAPTVRTILEPETGAFQIYGRNPGGDSGWAMHARGTIRARSEKRPVMIETLDEIRERCPIEVAHDDCYSQIREAGLDLVRRFAVSLDCGAARGSAWPESKFLPRSPMKKRQGPYTRPRWTLAFTSWGRWACKPRPGARAIGAFLFVEIGELLVYAWSGQPLWSRVWLSERGRDQMVVDCQVFEETGAVVWEARGLRCQAIGFGGRDAERSHDDLVYQSRWQVQPLPHRHLQRHDHADLVGAEPLGQAVRARPESYGRWAISIGVTKSSSPTSISSACSTRSRHSYSSVATGRSAGNSRSMRSPRNCGGSPAAANPGALPPLAVPGADTDPRRRRMAGCTAGRSRDPRNCGAPCCFGTRPSTRTWICCASAEDRWLRFFAARLTRFS